MAQAGNNPNTSSFYNHLQIDPEKTVHYALSETAELQLRFVRDGLRALAGLLRQDIEGASIPEEVTGEGLGAVMEVFSLATDAIIAATPFARRSVPMN